MSSAMLSLNNILGEGEYVPNMASQPSSVVRTDILAYRYLMSLLTHIHGDLLPTAVRNTRPRSSEGVRRRPSTAAGAARHSSRNRNPPTLPTTAPTQPLRQIDLWNVIGTIVKEPTPVRSGRVSKLGQAKARLGDSIGDGGRPRGSIRWEGTRMFGWVDGQWKPAAYHVAFREEFILMDAQQPGAPVWRKGMDLDYTSYSPVTRGWTEDPSTITDRNGRQVCFMQHPPEDWVHNPKSSYLTYQGFVILDVNNKPMKDFPGAPHAIASKAPACLLEGLRRCFGMTLWDIRDRMLPLLKSRTRFKHLAGYTYYTNCLGRWRTEINSGGPQTVHVWHERRKGKSPKDDDEDNDINLPSETMPVSAINIDESIGGLVDSPYPASLGTSTAMTATVGLTQHQPWDVSPTFLRDELYQSSGAAGMPATSYTHGQLGTQRLEQTNGENWCSAPSFPRTNFHRQSTNMVPSDSIYSAAYPSTFAPPPNIYTISNDYHAHIPVAPGFGSVATLPNVVRAATQKSYSQPNFNFQTRINEVQHDHPMPQQLEFQTHFEMSPPTTYVNSHKTTSMVQSASVWPTQNACMAFGRPEEDPFVGADWSPGTAEDWWE